MMPTVLSPTPTTASAGLRTLFGAAIFLGAFLLFLVEPIAAKQLLPVLGGSSSVWITCLVCFQAALLAGYLYAHWLSCRADWIGYVTVLGLSLFVASLWASGAPLADFGDRHPALTVLLALGEWIGLPFGVLAATSPLLQAWWQRVHAGPIPWRFYAVSNLASLLALAAYPALIEPYLTLQEQRVIWAGGFMVFAVVAAGIALRTSALPMPAPEAPVAESAPASVSAGQKFLWVLLPMAASMQLSAVTVHLTANIAAIPLLWILPLAAYLLSLICAFQFSGILRAGILLRLTVVVLGSIAYMLAKVGSSWPIRLSIPFFVIALFIVCLYLHAQTCAVRPARPSQSTLFYLLFAAGGALGSFLIGIAFPLLFRFNYDLPITFFVTGVLALASSWRTHWSQRMLWAAVSAGMLAVLLMVRIAYQRDTIVAVRNFYGSLRVMQDDYSVPGAIVRTVVNGSIQHGTQIFGTDEQRHTATTYYARDSGVGLALRNCCRKADGSMRPRRIGVIGLGAGTLAAYGRPGDHIRFYEINPAVEPIARDVFTYMRESGATIDVVPGDARTSLAHEPPQQFDVLVVDAFTGDAIPLHLLTREALALYRRHLAPGGIVAFHISNQHVDLESPVAMLAASAGMECRHVYTLANDARGEFNATWILVTSDNAFFLQPELVEHAFDAERTPRLRLWTDDYSALLPVLHW